MAIMHLDLITGQDMTEIHNTNINFNFRRCFLPVSHISAFAPIANRGLFENIWKTCQKLGKL